ncbi:MAG: SAM-dependent methyltransferase, partial [Oscillospiraceae bacterium]|nr:SAM-dependent methyltransferase [Oscillospiraceae bacterium]
GTLEQIAELSVTGDVLAFDFPLREVNFPERVRELEEITEKLGEKMQGGFTYNEVSRALYRLGFQIDTYLTPEKIQNNYFSNRTDGLSAFENVSLLSAIYTNGRIYE